MTDEVKRWTVPGKKLAPLRYETVEVVAAAEFDALADELAAERADHEDTMKRAQASWALAERRLIAGDALAAAIRSEDAYQPATLLEAWERAATTPEFLR